MLENQPRYGINRDDDIIHRILSTPKSWINIIIIIINILIYILFEITGSSSDIMHFIRWGASVPERIQQGEYYRLFTCMFLHFDIEHLMNNMVLLFFIGDALEYMLGKAKYLCIYLIGGVGASMISYWHNIKTNTNVISVGASGAVFAVIGALIYILLRNKGQLEGLSLKRVAIMAACSLYVGFASSGVDNFAHVGGGICGFILAVIIYRNKQVK